MHNIVSPDQMLRDILKCIKETKRDVGREPFLNRPVLRRDVEAVYLCRRREVGKDLCDPDRVAGAHVCDFQVLALGRDGRVQRILEAVLPEPVLQDETGRVSVAAGEDVVVVLVRFHLWWFTGTLFETCRDAWGSEPSYLAE